MKAFETLIGFLVLLFATYITIIFYYKSNVSYVDNYILYVNLSSSTGLKNGSDVRLNGVKIGHIVERKLLENYQVKVTLAVNKQFSLPIDSSAELTTEGFMGNRYMRIVPGFSTETLKHNDFIEYSQSYDFSLESIIEKFIVGKPFSEKTHHNN
ncbi:putative ABC transporter substrate binding protein [Candidatus Xenohaliotis californiensis]|uniref:ABC transporter substrate binding protein n=1 Tax=Candidatus Xenohaliotis californiensis TaxID=84677 RepID=A0ABM9N8V4_9RICK|nr:putative ABC transporter substrate binding protein [Candidatus Xenohaliotis californiensis]